VCKRNRLVGYLAYFITPFSVYSNERKNHQGYLLNCEPSNGALFCYFIDCHRLADYIAWRRDDIARPMDKP
jgi:hypothetical protein